MDSLQITKEDIEVLKNFSKINSSIVFVPGNKMIVVDKRKTIVGIYTLVDREIPVKFAIYNLSNFISGISLYKDCYLTFNDKVDDEYKKVDICFEGRSNILQYGLSSTILTERNTPVIDLDEISIPVSDYDIRLTKETIKKWKVVAKEFDFNFIRFYNDGEKLKINLYEDSIITNNVYSEETIAFNASYNSDLKMSIDKLVFLERDYDVKMSRHNISEWRDDELNLSYYVSLDN